MIAFGVLLVGIAVADLARRRSPWTAPGAGVVATLTVGLLAHGASDALSIVLVVATAGVVAAWAILVRRGLEGRQPFLPLIVLAAATPALLLAPSVHEWSAVRGEDVASALDGAGLGSSWPSLVLVLGLFGVQLSTGNVIVRLILSGTGTVSPAMTRTVDPDEPMLKGGRLLGPMERLMILGLGMAGNLTAAAIVVAAKGLLRFPELSSRRDQERLHQLTEYFLVGSFASWLIALGSLAVASLR